MIKFLLKKIRTKYLKPELSIIEIILILIIASAILGG